MNRLKELREERGYSTRQMENKLDISYAVINYYENEKRDPSTKNLKILADFFEVSIDYLLNYSDCYVYANYELESFSFKIRDNFYHELTDKGYIYFKDDKRYVDLNKIFNINPDDNLLPIVLEFARVKKADALFDMKHPTAEDIDELKKDITDIEINQYFINMVKDAIR